jgi:hypothetical protein
MHYYSKLDNRFGDAYLEVLNQVTDQGYRNDI